MSVILSRPPTLVASHYLYPRSLPFHGTRNPVTNSGQGFRAKFASCKNRRMVRCESLLEMHFLYLAEFARNVVSFDEQPLTVSYRLNGWLRRYTPDFVLRWRDGSQWFVEVKPAELLSLPRNQEKFACVAEHFRRGGDTFITMSEHEIRHPVRMPLVRDLLRLRDEAALASLSEMENIDLGTYSSWGALREELDAAQAMTCLAYRLITCSLFEPVRVTTPIASYKESEDVALFN